MSVIWYMTIRCAAVRSHTSDDWSIAGDRRPGSVTLNIDLMNDEHSVSPVSVGDLLVSENMETIITENTPALVAIEEE